MRSRAASIALSRLTSWEPRASSILRSTSSDATSILSFGSISSTMARKSALVAINFWWISSRKLLRRSCIFWVNSLSIRIPPSMIGRRRPTARRSLPSPIRPRLSAEWYKSSKPAFFILFGPPLEKGAAFFYSIPRLLLKKYL